MCAASLFLQLRQHILHLAPSREQVWIKDTTDANNISLLNIILCVFYFVVSVIFFNSRKSDLFSSSSPSFQLVFYHKIFHTVFALSSTYLLFTVLSSSSFSISCSSPSFFYTSFTFSKVNWIGSARCYPCLQI